MRPNFIWRVAWRDLLNMIRDRRALMASIVMPLFIIPLFVLGLPLLMAQLIGGQAVERQKVGVIGELPPAFTQLLKSQSEESAAGLELLQVTDPMQAVRSDKVEAVIKVSGPLPEQLKDPPQQLELYAKLGNLRTQAGAYSKVNSAVEMYNRQLLGSQLTSLGFDSSALEPVNLKPIDASPPQERSSGQLAFLVPMLMLQFILSGAMAIALDSTAGEKERGTLESLLVSPVRRSEVVAGKLVATTLVALVSALFSLLGFILSGLVGQLFINDNNRQMVERMGGRIALSSDDFIAMLFIMITSAFLISSALIAISVYARSYKEAQTYVAPITMLIIFPAISLQFSDFWQISSGLYFVPLVGGMFSLLEIVKGSTEWQNIALALLGNLLLTLLFGILALHSFSREQVIFRN